MKLFKRNIPGGIRPPAVADRFYPGNATELRRMIGEFLQQAGTVTGPPPKALVVPHAGYVYSGPVAASAYARWVPARERIKRVVLIGPSHQMPFIGLAATSAIAFTTPLGTVPVDTASVRSLCARLSQVSVIDDAHTDEHSLEVHLPFLQMVLADFEIVPILVGDASHEDVAEVIEALWDGDKTRLVVSSDLSHYYDYAGAVDLDTATARAIEGLRADDVGEEQACGHIAICGLLRAARQRRLRVSTLDLRNSGDTMGPRDQVVGYGVFAFGELL